MNVFDVIRMNNPTPAQVLDNCFDAIDCCDDIDRDEVDVIWHTPHQHCSFMFSKVEFNIFYNIDEQRTELTICVDDDIYKQHILRQRKYPQYQNKTDEQIWPQKYFLTQDLDCITTLSCAYEDISNNIFVE